MSRLTYRDEHGTAKLFQETLRRNPHAFAEKLAHYEDLEEAGRLIELPCKVGDTVHFLTRDGRILDTTLDDLNTVYRFKDLIGKAFYLTKAEAEAKLAEMQPLPILHGNIAPNSKEEALERLGISPNNLAELKGENNA